MTFHPFTVWVLFPIFVWSLLNAPESAVRSVGKILAVCLIIFWVLNFEKFVAYYMVFPFVMVKVLAGRKAA